jgi:hemerythrin
MKWRKKYSVGVKALDDEHEGMMRLLNEIHAAALKGRVGEVAGPLLDQIAWVSKEHFNSEEELMERTRYPGLAEHRAKHRELTAKASEFTARHDAGDSKSYVQLLYYVREWFRDHMMEEDHKFTFWMKERGVQ